MACENVSPIQRQQSPNYNAAPYDSNKGFTANLKTAYLQEITHIWNSLQETLVRDPDDPAHKLENIVGGFTEDYSNSDKVNGKLSWDGIRGTAALAVEPLTRSLRRIKEEYSLCEILNLLAVTGPSSLLRLGAGMTHLFYRTFLVFPTDLLYRGCYETCENFWENNEDLFNYFEKKIQPLSWRTCYKLLWLIPAIFGFLALWVRTSIAAVLTGIGSVVIPVLQRISNIISCTINWVDSVLKCCTTPFLALGKYTLDQLISRCWHGKWKSGAISKRLWGEFTLSVKGIMKNTLRLAPEIILISLYLFFPPFAPAIHSLAPAIQYGFDSIHLSSQWLMTNLGKQLILPMIWGMTARISQLLHFAVDWFSLQINIAYQNHLYKKAHPSTVETPSSQGSGQALPPQPPSRTHASTLEILTQIEQQSVNKIEGKRKNTLVHQPYLEILQAIDKTLWNKEQRKKLMVNSDTKIEEIKRLRQLATAKKEKLSKKLVNPNTSEWARGQTERDIATIDDYVAGLNKRLEWLANIANIEDLLDRVLLSPPSTDGNLNNFDCIAELENLAKIDQDIKQATDSEERKKLSKEIEELWKQTSNSIDNMRLEILEKRQVAGGAYYVCYEEVAQINKRIRIARAYLNCLAERRNQVDRARAPDHDTELDVPYYHQNFTEEEEEPLFRCVSGPGRPVSR